MTIPPPRPVRPTPGILAGRPRRILTARPQGAAGAGPDSFVRCYAEGVQAAVLHPHAKRLALALAGLADPETGRLPEGTRTGPRDLARLTGLGLTAVRNSRGALQRAGWIHRIPAATSDQPSRIELQIPDPAPETMPPSAPGSGH